MLKKLRRKMADFGYTKMPKRDYMDDPNIKWRYGKKPDFTAVNKTWARLRCKNHAPGSLEETVENLVKTFEMEASYKIDPKDWGTVDTERFTIQTNGGKVHTFKELIEQGTYNVLMDDCPFYDNKAETYDSSHHLFRSTFPSGFAWELLEILSGPPVVSFTWRHFTDWEGPYKGVPPDGKPIDIHGVGIATLCEGPGLKLKTVKIYYDPNPTMARMSGNRQVKKI